MLVVVPLLGAATALAQVPDAEARFVEQIDQERASRQLHSLRVAPDLVEVARRHAHRMAERGEPYHNPDLTTEVQGWRSVGENVGGGWDVDRLHAAFMASSTHRGIILSGDFTEVGVGVVRTDDGQLWVVQVFRSPTSAQVAPASATPPPPPPQPQPAPPPLATAPAPPTAAASPAAVVPTTEATTTTVPPPPAADLTPSAATPSADELALAAHSAAPPIIAELPISAVPAELSSLTQQVPFAAWVAASLLAAVVGGQGLVLRRLGLVA